MSGSHHHGYQQHIGYSDVIGTVTEEDNDDEEDEMEVAVIELQHPHGDQQLVSCLDLDTDGEPCNPMQQPILCEDFDEEFDLVLASK